MPKLPSPNFLLPDLFGITKFQLASLCYAAPDIIAVVLGPACDV